MLDLKASIHKGGHIYERDDVALGDYISWGEDYVDGYWMVVDEYGKAYLAGAIETWLFDAVNRFAFTFMGQGFSESLEVVVDA